MNRSGHSRRYFRLFSVILGYFRRLSSATRRVGEALLETRSHHRAPAPPVDFVSWHFYARANRSDDPAAFEAFFPQVKVLF